jgi:hypothetical protein
MRKEKIQKEEEESDEERRGGKTEARGSDLDNSAEPRQDVLPRLLTCDEVSH